MNYLVMDRASEAAANDLAEVRKLIEGMNALVNSQIQQQQQQAQQQQLHLQFPEYPTHEQQQQQEAALMAATLAAATEHQHYLNVSPSPSPSLSPQQTLNSTVDTSQLEQSNAVNEKAREESFNNTATEPVKPQEASKSITPPPSTQQQTTDTAVASAASAANAPIYSAPLPQAGVIVEVIHLTFNRVLYFQLAEDVTIEPMIAWLRLSYQDAAISGMVLQYKGFDGLWKCLLNRDDSLKRILKQSMKGNTMLQMRVPREQDLLSSGYTDRRLLALTKTERM
ncbi:hypothetical protein PS15m_002711 [Mucor circinelloides]